MRTVFADVAAEPADSNQVARSRQLPMRPTQAARRVVFPDDDSGAASFTRARSKLCAWVQEQCLEARIGW
ncbi:hypothetical protein ABZW96_09890 [Nocardia sp. NPDC004168]|uniref:hypothetical protein n=1 Tax=Nocardia TaxID=1817 RepID=UPI0033B0BC8A